MKRLNKLSTVILGVTFFALSKGQAIDCSKQAGSLPDATVQAGTPNAKNPIEHIVVIMQENHSFDNYFGRLNQADFYGNQVDGISSTLMNPDKNGTPVFVYKESNLCPKDPIHSWDGEHIDWNSGKNDKFVAQNDAHIMGYYDQTDIPYYYGLANQFAIADRYFCSTLASTFPNRFFLMTGTAFGHIKNDFPTGANDFKQKTIFDSMTDNNVSWKYYTDDKGYLSLFKPMYQKNLSKMGKIADYFSDINQGKLPQVIFIDASFDGQDEHPTGDIQNGESWTAANIDALINSTYWKSSVIFLTYDENGGFFDHVSPPPACAPDSILPKLNATSQKGAYDRYGFRVPFIAISPYAKHHYVSHNTYDHTSILKFIETKFNLPALSKRDANADGLADVFDYMNPVLSVNLPTATVDQARLCQ